MHTKLTGLTTKLCLQVVYFALKGILGMILFLLFYSHIGHKILNQPFIVCLESDTQSLFARYVVGISATLAALHPTVRLSPWRQVWIISTSGCGAMVSPDLYSTQEGPWPHSGSP